MEPHLVLDELAFHKPEDQAGLAGAHVPKKNLAIKSNRAEEEEASACQHPHSSKSPYETTNPN